MRFYTVDQLGPNRHLTPEGFLVCRDVPIGRTGDMTYVAGEVPVKAGPDGLIRITRDADAVFHNDTIASFQGKPITLDHPASDVTPANWSGLAKGIVQHVRRGAGASDSLLLADLLITDQAAIAAVRDGLRQVSCGYDAEYEMIEPGRGRQRNIIGNHVALVEKGRCGPSCAIGDKYMPATAKKTRWTDFKARMAAAFKARDEGEMQTLLTEAPEPDDPSKGEAREEGGSGNSSAEGGLAARIDALIARMEALEARMTPATADKKAKDESNRKKEDSDEEDDDEEEEEEERKRKKSDDAMPTRDALQDIFSRAEILYPGLRLPTFDAKAEPSKVRDSLCDLKRKALAHAYDTTEGRAAIVPFAGDKPDFNKLTCDGLHSVFVGASELMKRANNAQAANMRVSHDNARQVASKIAEINKANAALWSHK